MTEAFEICGVPSEGGVLIVADHASNHVPDDIDLGISPQFLNDHIAFDPGTAPIARLMTESSGYLAILASASRLVVDLNRFADEPSAIPERSDGVEIPGNRLTEEQREARMGRFFWPYHDRIDSLIADLKPALVLSLHSFTPALRSNPRLVRPWDMGILYNEYETASRLALQFLDKEGMLNVGDQLPYSGKQLNATMDQHCEPVGQPYFGAELRQDLIMEPDGQRRFADILLRTCDKIRTALA
ncbi:N-formylglutamate amidohydrolase [Parasphingorhabdus sp.]|uniref:N-formylglutamate amidohydrolase n=1 Tax=Parasphingorhabdus sp. TaxID=2709688 RepID=UPI0030013F6C